MLKKLIIIIILVGAAGAAGYYFYSRHITQQQNEQANSTKVSTLDLAKDPKYNDFSLHGVVKSFSDKKIVFTATVIKNGDSVVLEKIAVVDDRTAIFRKSSTGDQAAATIKDLAVGQTLVFHTQIYPYGPGPIAPYRIEILK